MNQEQLRALIERGESLHVEFKGEERRPLSDDEIVQAVVCMANRPATESGWVLIGVEDDGRVTGARPRHGNRTDPLQLQALIANRTRPSLAVRVFVVPWQTEGVEIITIEVPPVRIPVATADGRYLRRAMGGRGEPECVPMHFHDIQSLLSTRGLLDYSTLVVEGAKWEDLDRLEFERFRRFVRESRGRGDEALLDLPDEELAKALGAVEGEQGILHVRVLGLLLFGEEEALRRLLPTHEVAFQVLDGAEVQVNEFFRYPLLRVMEEILARFRARYREEEMTVGLSRVGIPEYSERAFREAVANAFIHRDYTRLGAVHIQWYEDRIEISNPGGFRRASIWATSWWRPPGRETRFWRMPSSGRASWSAPAAELTSSSPSSCATAARLPPTSGAPIPMWWWCFGAGKPTWRSCAWWRRKTRRGASWGWTNCSCSTRCGMSVA
jgi:ATP-dependent DNA helicase RecG